MGNVEIAAQSAVESHLCDTRSGEHRHDRPACGWSRRQSAKLEVGDTVPVVRFASDSEIAITERPGAKRSAIEPHHENIRAKAIFLLFPLMFDDKICICVRTGHYTNAICLRMKCINSFSRNYVIYSAFCRRLDGAAFAMDARAHSLSAAQNGEREIMNAMRR